MYGDKVNLERNILASVLRCGRSELAQEVSYGLDEALFSGIRKRIVRFFNANLRHKKAVEAIVVFLQARAKNIPELQRELDEILSFSGIPFVETYKKLIKELTAINVSNKLGGKSGIGRF